MENKFIRVDEVADELGVSRPYAYKLIRQLNEGHMVRHGVVSGLDGGA